MNYDNNTATWKGFTTGSNSCFGSHFAGKEWHVEAFIHLCNWTFADPIIVGFNNFVNAFWRHWVEDGSGPVTDYHWMGNSFVPPLGLVAEPTCQKSCVNSGVWWSGEGAEFPDFLKCSPQELTFAVNGALLCITDGHDYGGGTTYTLDNNRQFTACNTGSVLFGIPDPCPMGGPCDNGTWNRMGTIMQYLPFFGCGATPYPSQTQSYGLELGSGWANDPISGFDFICYCMGVNQGIPVYAFTTLNGLGDFTFQLGWTLNQTYYSAGWSVPYNSINWCSSNTMSGTVGDFSSIFSSHPSSIDFVVSSFTGNLP